MTVLNAHFDGKQFVLDDPVPVNLQANAKARIIVDADCQPRSLARIAAMAVDADLPRDYAEQHEHYVKGTPRR
jgi:hypothetical protein